MKKITFAVLLLTICSISLLAQKKHFEYGIHGGVNLSSGRSDAFNNAGSLTGLNVGLDVLYKFSEHMGLKLMPQFDQNGWAFRSLTFEGNPPGGPLQKADALVRLAYLNLPIMADYTFGGKTTFNVGAGFFGGLLLEELLVIKPDKASNATLVQSSTSTENYKKFNYGLSLSTGARIPLNDRLKLQVGLLNNLGLANINKTGEKISTNALSAILGLAVQFK